MKVLLCGGGNAIHVLTSYIGERSDCEVCILSICPGEAERLNASIKDDGIACENDLSPNKVHGKPDLVTDNPAETVASGDIDIVIMAIPSTFHEDYLQALKPYLKPGCSVGAMPGQSGFDLCVRHILGSKFVQESSIFALETLPWACRILEYGCSVQVLGTKKEIGIVVAPPSGQSAEATVQTLQKLIGQKPMLQVSYNFLAQTLMNPNAAAHPTISYGFYYDKDLAKPFDEPPLFYQGVDENTGKILSKVSDECMALKRVLIAKYPGRGLDLSAMIHLKDTLLLYYYDKLGDKTNISTMLRTSSAHRGLVHPMIEVDTPDGKKYMPNFKNRYFTEDLPCGMIVIRGIAELAGVSTPTMDEIILWCQNKMEKEFLKDGKVAGKDVKETRSPQRYGFTDLDTFMTENGYIVEASYAQ